MNQWDMGSAAQPEQKPGSRRLPEFDSITRSLSQTILSAKRYGELPNRLIVKSPFCDKPLISYGVIPYCLATRKWLLVKRRHSPEEIIMMRGSYRNAEIPRLLEGKSKAELAKDRATLADPSLFAARFAATIGTSSRDLNYALNRFLEARDLIETHLGKTTGQNDTEWLFPKGRILATSETPHTCALREFHEESGIQIQQSRHSHVDTFSSPPSNPVNPVNPSDDAKPEPVNGGTSDGEASTVDTETYSLGTPGINETQESPEINETQEPSGINEALGTPGINEILEGDSLDPIDPLTEVSPRLSQSLDSIIGNAYLISDRPLVDSFRATNGRVYETRCWIYVFPTEVQPPPVTQLETPGEIGDRRWVSQEEARELLSPHKYQILEKAFQLIRTYQEKLDQVKTGTA
jgi:hypothetical protein